MGSATQPPRASLRYRGDAQRPNCGASWARTFSRFFQKAARGLEASQSIQTERKRNKISEKLGSTGRLVTSRLPWSLPVLLGPVPSGEPCLPSSSVEGPAMSAEGSVSQWLGRLQDGDPSAARQLWSRYFPRLVALAREKLR